MPAKAPRTTRGFTLLELAAVIGIISILATLGAPAFRNYVLRAQAAEAYAMVESIAHAELTYKRDHGRYLAVPANPAGDLKMRPALFDTKNTAWKQLSVSLQGELRYQYEVKLDGRTFVVIARGDLDGDGESSRFEMRGDTLNLTVTDELE